MSIRFLLLICLFSGSLAAQAKLWRAAEGRISFTSDAPLELIQAQSEQLQGVIKTADGGFAFSMEIRSFQGFNSSLQREHFNENYLESDRFPKATFKGNFSAADPINWKKDGTYERSVKGELSIHGITKQLEIPVTIQVGKGKTTGLSTFVIAVADYDIAIPKVVQENIAKEIKIEVKADFQPLTQ